MKKNLFLIPLLSLIFLTGCTVYSSDNPGLFSKKRTYKIEIIKSIVNTNSFQYESKERELLPTDLLDKAQIQYEKNNNKITKLDGVITTASKQWNLYVNDQKTDLSTTIPGDSKIEWRYEIK
ncbi:MAG: hypothetical protein GX926_01160 [Candidatus Magasanikbacteria bacterium]|nr:hypothetical protein [Candidatus Magasanikbacteria bacterium]